MKLPAVLGLIALLSLIAVTAVAFIKDREYQKLLRGIPIRVLVNGTRGKTTTTRLIHAGLVGAGYKAHAKSTGSESMTLDENLNAMPLERERGWVSIGEVVGFVEGAARKGCDALVVECMAVRPDLQKSLARSILKPTHVVILNDYVDHVDAMGNTRKTTARALLGCVTKESQVFVGEDFSLKKQGFVVTLAAPEEDCQGFLFPAHPVCVGATVKVLESLSVPREKALQGMRKAPPDKGLVGPFKAGNTLYHNLFAANDIHSARQLLLSLPKGIGAVYNSRADRGYRTPAFAKLLKNLGMKQVAVMGTDKEKAYKAFENQGLSPAIVAPEEVIGHFQGLTDVALLGNIKGEGAKLIDIFLKEGSNDGN